MQEKILKVGSPIPISGVLGEPENPKTNLPAVLILNSGLMHHVGTCRLSVKLARALADNGAWSARFDFPGIGDSAFRRDQGSHLKSSPPDVIEVMDELEKITGLKRFVIFGLCSGADAAFVTSLVEPRVVGIAQIDPFLYRTGRWYLNHYGKRILNLGTWLRAVKRVLYRKKDSSEMPGNSLVETVDDVRDIPPMKEVASGYSKIINNGVAVLNIITGGQSYRYNYHNQFYDIFRAIDWGEQLTMAYFPEAEHVITEPEYQEKAKNLIVDWILNKKFK